MVQYSKHTTDQTVKLNMTPSDPADRHRQANMGDTPTHTHTHPPRQGIRDLLLTDGKERGRERESIPSCSALQAATMLSLLSTVSDLNSVTYYTEE